MFFPSPPHGRYLKLIPIKFYKYYWLGPDLTRNTRRRYIPVILLAAVMLTLTGYKPLKSYLLLSTSYEEVIIFCIFLVVLSATPPSIIRGI